MKRISLILVLFGFIYASWVDAEHAHHHDHEEDCSTCLILVSNKKYRSKNHSKVQLKNPAVLFVLNKEVFKVTSLDYFTFHYFLERAPPYTIS